MQYEVKRWGLLLLFTSWCLLVVSSASLATVVDGVPYRNQVLDFPNWWNNGSSCGYTCVLMALLFNETLPAGLNEQEIIESLDKDCSMSGVGSYYYFENLPSYCQTHLAEYELQVDTFYSDFNENTKKLIDEGWPVILGTNIFGNEGHVILIVGYDDSGWIVHDPAMECYETKIPDGGIIWSRAEYVHYPYDSFTILYGSALKCENHKKFAAKITERSPEITTIMNEETHDLWVKFKNTGKETWMQEEIRLSTILPNDRNCGIIAKNKSKSDRWLSSNRIRMEQKIVEPGQMATFVFPVGRNGLTGDFVESFRLVRDVEKGGRFGPSIPWRLICKSEIRNESDATGLEDLWSTNNPLANLGEQGAVYYFKGSIHNHTNYSDGKLSIDELAKEAKKLGLKFMVISDHAEAFDNSDKFQKYIAEIAQAATKNGICITAGLEYTILKNENIISAPEDSSVHLLGAGYNQKSDSPIVPEEFIPWLDKGKNITLTELINWHYEKKLPIIICHPFIRGKNGLNAAEMICAGKFGDPVKIAGIEFFDIGFDTYFGAITDDNKQKIQNPGIEFGKNWELYNNYLANAGVGITASSDYHGKIGFLGNNLWLDWDKQEQMSVCLRQDKLCLGKVDKNYGRCLQSLDRAKTTICTHLKKLTVAEVVEGLNKRRTIASRYHETFDWFMIEDKPWVPGKCNKVVQVGKNPIISYQIQFHEGDKPGSEDRVKIIIVIRDGKLIKNIRATLDGQGILNYTFNDSGLKPGIHSYIFLVSGLEQNDWRREKIVTSPLYLNCADRKKVSQPMQTNQDGTKTLSIFTDCLHLGDSCYGGEMNAKFQKKYHEGRVGHWIFDLSEQDLHFVSSCKLTMKLAGAELFRNAKNGNQIHINGHYVADCVVKDNLATNNWAVHMFVVPLNYLLVGPNELMIRSYAEYAGKHFNHLKNIDCTSNMQFDDFEMEDIKLVFNPGNNRANIQSAKAEDYLAQESLDFTPDNDSAFTEEEKATSRDLLEEFRENGGKFLEANDPRYQKFMEMFGTTGANLDKYNRYQSFDFKIFDSPTLDPIALPDGTILVPTGLIDFQDKDLPESLILPIISAMIQADKGISTSQAHRSGIASTLSKVGSIFEKITGGDSDTEKYIGMGIKIAQTIALKTKPSDYFVADAEAMNILQEMGLDDNDAFCYLDALATKEQVEKNKLLNLYIFAPSAGERLKALQKYNLYKNIDSYPISPVEFNWDKAINEE